MDDAKNVFTQEAEAPILGVALTASLPNLLRVALQVSEACFAILKLKLLGGGATIKYKTTNFQDATPENLKVALTSAGFS